jgi:hypothetical protein
MNIASVGTVFHFAIRAFQEKNALVVVVAPPIRLHQY